MAYEYYATDLPGKMLYEKAFSVKIRRITPIEQRYLVSLGQKQQATSKDYFDFIKKLIEFDNPEMKFEDLFWYDVQYLLYRIRFNTYPSYPPKLIFTCNGEIEGQDESGNKTTKDCDEKITQDLDIGALVTTTPDDLPNYTSTIELSKGPCKIRPKTMGDDLEVEKFLKKRGLSIEDVSLRALLLELCLIRGERDLEEMYTLAEQDEITAEDIVKIEKWFTDNIFGIKEQLLVKCPKCGKEEVRVYDIDLAAFFSVI